MKRELEDQLKEKYPKTFKILNIGRKEDAPFWGIQTWGFECADGWFDIINRLCEKIEPIIEQQENPDDYYVEQVKEKFAGLRFYMSLHDEKIEECIRQAEEESFKTCEYCGNPGVVRRDGWLKTMCDACYKEDQERKIKDSIEWVEKQLEDKSLTPVKKDKLLEQLKKLKGE